MLQYLVGSRTVLPDTLDAPIFGRVAEAYSADKKFANVMNPICTEDSMAE